MVIIKCIFVLCMAFFGHYPAVQPIDININQIVKDSLIYKLSYFEDKSSNLDAYQAIRESYKSLNNNHSNFGLTNSAYWIKIEAINRGLNQNQFLLKLANGNIKKTEFYKINNDVKLLGSFTSTSKYDSRLFNSQYPIFKVDIQQNSICTFLLRVNSDDVMDLSITLDTIPHVLNAINFDQFIFGIYSGIIIIMFIYNLFVFLVVKDKVYIYYVMYILFVGVLQGCLKGYASKFLWPNNAWLIQFAPNLFISLSGIFSIFFVFSFLHIKKFSCFLYKILIVQILIYFVGAIIDIGGNLILSQKVLQLNASIVAITILLCGITVYRKQYHPALFFNISWSFFLSGVLIYILKDRGVLNSNSFTNNAILIGSSLEVALLSFALADKINIYKKEKEEFQAKELVALTENSRLINEQNITLERNVKERTQELTVANHDLSITLTDLKDAQIQLVEAEKMASLGQLTAGIAHEINNPINFVTANVSPLKRDVDVLVDALSNIELVGLSDISMEQKRQQIEDFKEDIDLDYLKLEINQLLDGIHDGASRTAEIVKGLKIFSRLDEDVLKKANINEGLDSTLIIANNLIGNKIELVKNLGNIPHIECYPGKLNQVFLNIISNAAFAIQEKFGDKVGGILKITTLHDNQFLYIKIEDNGTGMSEATKLKIFEPFFTTKDVGVGTGLGMSIVYNTIKKHGGDIELNSTEGLGTEFILRLNLVFEEVL